MALVKSSRSLTSGEILLAQNVFGSSIQFVRVKIHHGKYVFIQPDDAAMAPNGEIYFPTSFYLNDYAQGNARDKALFVHEMTHVWQYQLGYPVKAIGLIESTIGSLNGFGYDYTLRPNTRLSDYPMEAQANIIADYAMYVLYGQPAYYSKRRYNKPATSLAALQAVLTDFINNPGDVSLLPKANDSKCEAEPNTIDCLTR